ncbi:MAG: alpha/beta hydrolase [Dongiaceae bacterium]
MKTIRHFFAGTVALALAACASTGMPPDIQEKVKAIGAVIDPPKTAAIYAPLQAKEPYEGVRVTRDLKYGPDGRHALDLFIPTRSSSPAPVLIFVHGGAFVAGNKRGPGSPFYDNILLAAAKAGIVGVNMTYRLAPQHRWPTGAADVGDAVKWVRDNIASHGGDPARVTLMGHSAGAVHVASYVAFPEHHKAGGIGIAGAVLVSGLFDFTKMKPIGKPEAAYFGDLAGTAEVSSLAGLLRARIPLLVAYGEIDPPQFIDQSQLLNRELCARSVCPNLVFLTGHSHMSEVYSINTADTSLGAPVMEFVKRVK